MKRETKKQAIAIFILVMFGGSTLAFAFLSIYPTTNNPNAPSEQLRLLYTVPLSDLDEAEYLQQNIVVLKFFYTEECESCDQMNTLVDQLLNYELNGKIMVEKINKDNWEFESSFLGIQSVPAFYIKGASVDLLEGEITIEAMKTRICAQYFSPIAECN